MWAYRTPGAGPDDFPVMLQALRVAGGPDECVIELATKTVHGLAHLGWVPTDDGGYELRVAALVKPNGLFGRGSTWPASSRSGT